MKWNGRKVLTAEEWDYSEAKIGDLVEQELVDDMLDLLPPACMQPDCSQMGEAYSHRQDPDTGKWRPTFHTFKKVGGKWPNGIFEYCGKCFCGENVERGESPYHG